MRVSKGSREDSKSCRIDSNTSSASRAAICSRWIFRGWWAPIIGQSRIMADRTSTRLTWSSISSIDSWNQWIRFSCCFVIDSYISSCRSWSMKEGIVFAYWSSWFFFDRNDIFITATRMRYCSTDRVTPSSWDGTNVSLQERISMTDRFTGTCYDWSA